MNGAANGPSGEPPPPEYADSAISMTGSSEVPTTANRSRISADPSQIPLPPSSGATTTPVPGSNPRSPTAWNTPVYQQSPARQSAEQQQKEEENMHLRSQDSVVSGTGPYLGAEAFRSIAAPNSNEQDSVVVPHPGRLSVATHESDPSTPRSSSLAEARGHTAAYLYSKRAILFFVALLCTWVRNRTSNILRLPVSPSAANIDYKRVDTHNRQPRLPTLPRRRTRFRPQLSHRHGRPAPRILELRRVRLHVLDRRARALRDPMA
jgi:hypothetical protein